MGGRVEALISAVNMTLKLEEYQRAAEQYGELLGRDLEPPVMKIIERKHKEAADKLAAQNLLRAENKARRRRACPTSSPHPNPAPPRAPPRPALPRPPERPTPTPEPPPHNPRPRHRHAPPPPNPRLRQAVGSQDHLPAVAVLAFPVEDDVDEGDEGPPQASGLGQLLNFFNSGTTVPTKTANSGLCCAAKRT